MTFFYDLNKKMADIANQQQLNEDKKVDENLMSLAGKIGAGAKKVGGAVLNKLGHGSDEDLIKDLQKRAGVPAYAQHGKLPGARPNDPSIKEGDFGPMEEAGGIPMTAKQKSFAKLAPPADKITFADKIAGAKQEVDEMLGDVAAEAMKAALSPKQKKMDRNHNGRIDAQDLAMLRAGKGKEETDEGALQAYLGKKKYGKEGMKALQKAGREGASEKTMDRIRDQHEVDEGWDDMLKDVEKRRSHMKTGEKKKTHKGEIEKTATGIRHTRSYDEKTGETDSDDGEGQAQKKGRGRPKGAGKRIGAKGPSGKSKLMTKEDAHGQAQQIYNDLADIRAIAKQAQGGGQFPQGFASRLESTLWAAMTMLKNQQPANAQVREEELDEKAVSQQQQKFMGMVHAMQKGEKVKGASPELKKVARTMKPKDAEDFAKTKHKGLPKKKTEEVEETTVAGSVAPSTEAPKSKGKGGMTFGKGIYDSMNRELEQMIAEGMNVSMNMNNDEHGGPAKSITVTATDDDAVALGKLLQMAGLGGHGHEHGGEPCPTCGESPCACAEQVDENSPDWPTDAETTGADDPLLNRWSGGLNKPKETGQTTTPVVNRDPRRGSFGPAEHEVDLREDDLASIKNLAGIKEAKKVEEDDVEEGNKFTGNLAEARAAGKTQADLDGDGDLEKVQEGVSNLWKEYKGKHGV